MSPRYGYDFHCSQNLSQSHDLSNDHSRNLSHSRVTCLGSSRIVTIQNSQVGFDVASHAGLLRAKDSHRNQTGILPKYFLIGGNVLSQIGRKGTVTYDMLTKLVTSKANEKTIKIGQFSW